MAVTFPEMPWLSQEDGANRYFLLDGAQCTHPADVLGRFPSNAARLFDGVLADRSADTSVYLVRIPAQMSPGVALAMVAGVANETGAITLLESSLSQDELVQRLMRRLDAQFPNGKAYLTRYFDGRVLPLLVGVLAPEQRESFLALGHTWHYVTPEGYWNALPLTAPASDPFTPPLRLAEEQRRKLVDDSYPYTLIDHFRLTDPELLAKVSEPDQYRFFRACVGLADRYGIRDGGRTLMVCTWALLSGEDYYLQPEWDQRLKDFGSGKRSARQIGDEAYPMEDEWSG